VLLGGGLSAPVAPRKIIELGVSGDRIVHTWRLFNAGRAPKIITTGGSRTQGPNEFTESESAKRFLIELGVPAESIIVENKSINTRENVAFTHALLREQLAAGQSLESLKLLVVTSASHMPRAVDYFSSFGLQVTAATTDIRVVEQFGFNIRNYLPDAVALARSTTAIKEYLGRAVAKVRNAQIRYEEVAV